MIQVNESFGDMAANASVSPIPVTFISWRHVPEIMVGGTGSSALPADLWGELMDSGARQSFSVSRSMTRHLDTLIDPDESFNVIFMRTYICISLLHWVSEEHISVLIALEAATPRGPIFCVDLGELTWPTRNGSSPAPSVTLDMESLTSTDLT